MAEKPFERPEEVRDFLGATVGNDVFKAMEDADPEHNVGNNVGQAPADDQQPQPEKPTVNQPADPNAPATPAIAPEANPQQAPPQEAPSQEAPQSDGQPGDPKLFLDKYRTEEEAKKAYHTLLHQNKALLGKLDRFEQTVDLSQPAQPRTEAVEPQLQESPRVNPAARSAGRQEFLNRLQESYGFSEKDVNGLIDLAAEDASARATAAVDAKNAPREKLEAAQRYMDSTYPEASQFSDEIAQFIESEPDLKAQVQSRWGTEDYQSAMEVAWLRYERTTGIQAGIQTEERMKANEIVREDVVEQARGDANMVSSSASSSAGVHETPESEVGVSAEEMNNLVRAYRAGHKEPLLRATIQKDLPDSIFNPDGR